MPTVLHKDRHHVPPNDVLRVQLLALSHDDPSVGHFGRDKTLELLSRTYSWPELADYVDKYAATCDMVDLAYASILLDLNPTSVSVVTFGSL